MGVFLREPAEQLGDTTPGAFDQLPLLEHPAITEAREATRLPRSRWFLLLAVLVCIIVTLPACGGGDCADDPTCPPAPEPAASAPQPPTDVPTPGVNCATRPELCS